MAYPRVSFAIDRGGTFTDIIALLKTGPGEAGELLSHKLLSQSPVYDDAPSQGIMEMLRDQVFTEERGFTGLQATDGGKICTKHIDAIRMGTTIATNALLEHKGVDSVLVVTKGFQDVLEIGTQARPDLFALNIKKNKPVSKSTIEAIERVRVLKAGQEAQHEESTSKELGGGPVVTGTSGDQVQVLVPLDAEDIKAKLQVAFDAGVRSAAISLMHGHTFPQHEQEVAALAKQIGFTHCSMSNELMPMIKYVPRTTTTSVDAYLTPLLSSYVSRFKGKFTTWDATQLLFMQSDGGLTSAESFHGFRAVLSGPAGGVVGFSRSLTEELGPVPIVGFDMGGTSTDVARCEGRDVQHVVEASVAGVTLQAPQLDIHTVAAGGGSILKWFNGMYVVGPQSAGALPGPSCYGRGGPLTVTDANLVLGHIYTEHFPKVFGPKSDEPLNKEAPQVLFKEVAAQVSKDLGRSMSVEQVALGFLAVANEAMSRPIRAITEAKGYRPSDHVLAVFGGAGGQHGCAVAEKLGVQQVFVPKHASVLSALGIGFADVVVDEQVPSNLKIVTGTDTSSVLVSLRTTFDRLEEKAAAKLDAQGFADDRLQFQPYLNLRFEGTTTNLMVHAEKTPWNGKKKDGSQRDFLPLSDVAQQFVATYRRQFGFSLKDRAIHIDDIRLRSVGQQDSDDVTTSSGTEAASFPVASAKERKARVFFEASGWVEVPIVESGENIRTSIQGPALVLLKGSTVLVEPACTAAVTALGNILLKTTARPQKHSVELDPLPLSVFAHRFMSIAEQMGVALQRTALSTNIKERYDFSCGLFDRDGHLVANAPHIPVHLGAMGRAIAFQKEHLGDQWKPGDVIVTNDPAVGGSHLPDITVITPCWHQGKVIFYVASRGHHSDIGGSTPGSMPPFSKDIREEGAVIRSFKLVQDGAFNEAGITELLMAPGKIPGLSGCRALVDVLSDLKAQVAANTRGVDLVSALIESVGLDVVEAYMGHIQDVAESSIRTTLKKLAQTHGTELESGDAMDDGTEIHCRIRINPEDGSATFDFSGSGHQVSASTNCPSAVVRSAVLYCLRCLIGTDIPLNEGAMRPITLITKPQTILHPSPTLPVVGGNVLTSQRITDVILYAMRVLAHSQGDMNNLTFGDGAFAYYETIAGGSGAGPGFNGASGVQTHMTNTRITDPEIMEARYPILLTEFRLRTGSGGVGEFNGGDGVVRSILFLKPVTLVILSERRALAPKGLAGGGNGQRGVNLLKKGEASTGLAMWDDTGKIQVNIGAKNTIDIEATQSVTIETPGGAGYGPRAQK